jgi:hypothetical protein
MSPSYEDAAMSLSVSKCMPLVQLLRVISELYDYFQPSVCGSLVNNYTEAFQDPKKGVQMQERLVVNQTQRVFTGLPVH